MNPSYSQSYCANLDRNTKTKMTESSKVIESSAKNNVKNDESALDPRVNKIITSEKELEFQSSEVWHFTDSDQQSGSGRTFVAKTYAAHDKNLDFVFILKEYARVHAIDARDYTWSPITLPLELLAYVFGKNLESHEWKLIDCWYDGSLQKNQISTLKRLIKWAEMPLVFQAEIAKIANIGWKSQSKIMDETMLLNCLQVICQQFITKSNGLEMAAAFVYKLWELKFGNTVSDEDFSPILLKRYKSVVSSSPNRNIWRKPIVLPNQSQFNFSEIYPRAFNLIKTQGMPQVFKKPDQDVVSRVSYIQEQLTQLDDEIQLTEEYIETNRNKLIKYQAKRVHLTEQLWIRELETRFLDRIRSTFGEGLEAITITDDIIQAMWGKEKPNFKLIFEKLCELHNYDVKDALKQINEGFLKTEDNIATRNNKATSKDLQNFTIQPVFDELEIAHTSSVEPRIYNNSICEYSKCVPSGSFMYHKAELDSVPSKSSDKTKSLKTVAQIGTQSTFISTNSRNHAQNSDQLQLLAVPQPSMSVSEQYRIYTSNAELYYSMLENNLVHPVEVLFNKVDQMTVSAETHINI